MATLSLVWVCKYQTLIKWTKHSNYNYGWVINDDTTYIHFEAYTRKPILNVIS